MELSELKSHLWEAAYILPLLFFKRISDVWDEEHARMLEEYGEDFPDEHRFQVPDGCHWNDVRSTLCLCKYRPAIVVSS